MTGSTDHPPVNSTVRRPTADPAIGLVAPPTLRSQLLSAATAEWLETHGEVTYYDDPAELAGQLPNVEVLATSWGMPTLTTALLDTAPRLRLVAHTGASVRPFVTDAVFERASR